MVAELQIAMDGRVARKAQNRDKLIEAAFTLFSREGVEGLTMRKLAAEAGVSPATPYNLFGSKSGILAALFDTALDRLPEGRNKIAELDELDRILFVVDRVAELWSEPSGLFRKLLAAMKTEGELPPTVLDRPALEITRALQGLVKSGWISSTPPPATLAALVARANAGLFELWVAGRVPQDRLRAELRINLLVPLLSAATPAGRARLQTALELEL